MNRHSCTLMALKRLVVVVETVVTVSYSCMSPLDLLQYLDCGCLAV